VSNPKATVRALPLRQVLSARKKKEFDMTMKLRKQNRRFFQRAFTFAETNVASLALGLTLTSFCGSVYSSGMIKARELRATQVSLEQMHTQRTARQVDMNRAWLEQKQSVESGKQKAD